MGKSDRLVIVKLGGSVVTNKDKPLSPNIENIRLISRQLSRTIAFNIDSRIVLIHGGGSFGHYYAKKFGIDTNPASSALPKGLAWTASAMMKLHSIILEEFCKAGVYCATILPDALISSIEFADTRVSPEGEAKLDSIFQNDLLPVTFGYISLAGDKSFIISGDRIALALARSFSVERTVFVMDVDGVFQTSDLKGPPLRELKENDLVVQSSLRGYDVTGGIRAKITTGFELAGLGSEVDFVNGTKSNRLLKVLKGTNEVVATRIYPTKNLFHIHLPSGKNN